MTRLGFISPVVVPLILSCFWAHHAAADQAGCFTDDIHRITVPIDYNDPEGKTIQLAYRLRRGAEDRPAIIVLPGGPGATSIREDTKATSGGIPGTYTVVLTDPRGAGCNDDPALSEDSYFKSLWLARDTLAIIRDLRQREPRRAASFILYGQSYGTIEATIAANLAASFGIPAPQAIVLEGTVGRSFESYAQYFAPFQEEWRALLGGLPANWRVAFKTGKFSPVLSPSSRDWASLVENDLRRGFLPSGEHVLEQELRDGRLLLMALRGFAATQLGDALAPHSRILRAIACAELYGDLYPGLDLKDGELITDGANACGISQTPRRRFDTADWPLTVPIVYFQGEHDPATPLWQARYHFAHQSQAPRYFVRIDQAAHAALSVTLDVGNCPARLWDAITDDLRNFASATARCDAL